jgi:murein L,D-transpeptidase YafK
MKIIILLTSLFITTSFSLPPDFLREQKKYERVKIAYQEMGALVTSTLKQQNIPEDELNIMIIAYKSEQQLELFAKNKTDLVYKKILSYAICASSGILGPKRKQGDSQVPEGFYHINRFNPASFFNLSLGLNYPNQADRRKSKAKNLGGDIFIHGDCVTIGCLPMNDKIKEIYIYAIQAHQNGQLNIPVYIFPFKMDNEKLNKFKGLNTDKKELLDFWDNLKTGYEKFNREPKELKETVDSSGNYIF